MRAIALNRFYLNGKDMAGVWGILVEDGSDGFLQFPKKKESITHDWLDDNGQDVDLSRIYFEAKEVTLKCAMIADSKEDFWSKYDAFLAEFARPGTQRLEVVELERSFNVFYKECTDFTRLTRIQGTNFIGCKFTMVLVEQEPKINPEAAFIIDEDQRFIIT